MNGALRQTKLSDHNTIPELVGSVEVGHVGWANYDHYGGRGGAGDRHMNNTEPIERGWLGNPYQLRDDTVDERRRVIAAYLRDFLQRVDVDPDFRASVDGLAGQRVACWCRGVSQERTPETWCHLDVVAAWVDRDLSPVFDYLRGAQR